MYEFILIANSRHGAKSGFLQQDDHLMYLSLSIMQADRAQSAGMLLRQVCANQAEELKAYKGAFPNIMKDMSDLRENYHKQQKELQLELNAKLSLQEEASKLRDRVDCLTNDIKQVTLHISHV